eukprot:gene272-896_t
MAAKFTPLATDLKFGPWVITAVKGSIMKSDDSERLAEDLCLPQLPEMLFGNNKISIIHVDGFGITFNAADALKRVNNKQDLMKVAVAEEWQRLRAQTDGIKEVVKPYDWTYTTDYKGTLIGTEISKLKVSETTEKIDLERLKIREKIFFYEDIILYEDELADNGMASLSIKIRVMAGSFFALLRFFLRVDNVLLRVNDTRIYHEAGKNFMLREYSSRQGGFSQVENAFADASELVDKLPLISDTVEKLEFITANDQTTYFVQDDG